MTSVVLPVQITTAVAANSTFTVPYNGQVQSDFTAGQTVSLEVYARKFTGLAVTFGASAATVTWPSGAPYSLPPGEYYIGFDLVGADALPDGVKQATRQDPAAAADVAALKTQFDALLGRLKTAGLMAS